MQGSVYDTLDIPWWWLDPEEGLHKDRALLGKHTGQPAPGDADAELQALATLSPFLGMRLEPCGTADWVSLKHVASSRERRRKC